MEHQTLDQDLSHHINIDNSNLQSQQTSGSILIKDLIYYKYETNNNNNNIQNTQINLPQTSTDLNNSNSNHIYLLQPQTKNQKCLSPSSNSSSSPSSIQKPQSNDSCHLNDYSSTNKQAKKSQKKKSSQITSEIDEERTSQLVSEILKNIKEKTKELESLNQNLKTSSSSNDTSLSSNQKTNKLNYNYIQDTEFNTKIHSNDSFLNDHNDSNDYYDSDGSKNSSHNHHKKSKTKRQVSAKINTISQKNIKNTTTIDIPNGWSRFIELSQNEKLIVYTSPNGSRIKSYQDLKFYLLSDQTCKCGLECPLNIYETFNFNPSIENSINKKIKTNSSTCACKHVNFGLKKEKKLGFVKILDEVNQNMKRVSNDKMTKTLPAKKKICLSNNNNQNDLQTSPNYFINIQESQLEQQQQQQQQSQPIIISNLMISNSDKNVSNSSLFSNTNSTQFISNNDLLYHTENYSFSTQSNLIKTNNDLNQSSMLKDSIQYFDLSSRNDQLKQENSLLDSINVIQNVNNDMNNQQSNSLTFSQEFNGIKENSSHQISMLKKNLNMSLNMCLNLIEC